MKKFFGVMVLVLFMLFAGNIFAQQRQQPEKMVMVPESALTPEQKAEIEAQNLEKKIQRYGKWVGMGEEIGKAVDGSLSAITKQAVDFSNTSLGRFTMFLVAWKVIGKDFIQFIVGLLLLAIGIPLWIWSYRKTCIPRRIVTEETAEGVKKYQIVNDENKDYEKGWHAGLFFVFVIICLMVIFV